MAASRKTRLLTDALRRELLKKSADGGPNAAVRVARAVIRESERGSPQHAKLLYDRIDGPVSPFEDQDGEPIPVTINIVSGEK